MKPNRRHDNRNIPGMPAYLKWKRCPEEKTLCSKCPIMHAIDHPEINQRI